jgi:uncharacterized protein (TIGR00255 family)
MTGFGKALCEFENKNITIEIKSLNSKQLDFNIRIPSYYKEKEIELRNFIGGQLVRGKVDVFVRLDSADSGKVSKINATVVKDYFEQLDGINAELNLISDKNEFLKMIMHFPDVLKVEVQELNKDEWNEFLQTSGDAVKELINFRKQEGQALEKDIVDRIGLIEEYLSEITQFEKQRIETVKERIKQALDDNIKKGSVDENRFEQELIYYLEKLDITEEKVRLKNHCRYFLETIKTDKPVGKKLGFISQEIGREINTIGSKANNSDIQRFVVQMKDELEKIKEQLLNIL